MADSDVGMTDGVVVNLALDRERINELRRWATIGGRTVEETVLVAIDEYLTVTDH